VLIFTHFCQKSVRFYEFLLIFASFCSFFTHIFLAHLAQIPQIHALTPNFDPKSNIRTEMNLKNQKKPQFSLKFPRRVSENKCPFT